ncbi:MAG: hypothetical protein Q8920_03520 [Bacillota bacterium]|nr:hypothetical protein [Bacillota bacterium]
MKLKSRLLVVTFFISTFLVFMSATIPCRIKGPNDISSPKFGLPLSFITQHPGATPSKYPINLNLSSPWDTPTEINWFFLLVSVMTVWIVLSLICLYADNLIRQKRRKS